MTGAEMRINPNMDDLDRVRVTVTVTMNYGEWRVIEDAISDETGRAFLKFRLPLVDALNDIKNALAVFRDTRNYD